MGFVMGKSLESSGSLPEGPVCEIAHRMRVATSWVMLINTGLFGVCEHLAWHTSWMMTLTNTACH